MWSDGQSLWPDRLDRSHNPRLGEPAARSCHHAGIKDLALLGARSPSRLSLSPFDGHHLTYLPDSWSRNCLFPSQATDVAKRRHSSLHGAIILSNYHKDHSRGQARCVPRKFTSFCYRRRCRRLLCQAPLLSASGSHVPLPSVKTHSKYHDQDHVMRMDEKYMGECR